MNKALRERLAGVQHMLDEVKGELWAWEDDEDLDEIQSLKKQLGTLRVERNTFRDMLVEVERHHQGGHSEIGRKIRATLNMCRHGYLPSLCLADASCSGGTP